MTTTRTNCKVLLYHSQNVSGNDYASNDHVALAEDLGLIQELGLKVIPLNWLVSWLPGGLQLDLRNSVGISFDDGVDADVHDLDFPGFGPQRSFLNIMRDFQDDFGYDAQPMLHATSFVIANPDARAVMDEHSLFAQGWMNDDWWGQGHDGLLAIASHGWDHAHPDLAHIGEQPDGHFLGVDDRLKADRQVVDAAEYISAQTGGRWPDRFAYHYGHVNEYLPGEYFPANVHHKTRAAFTTEPVPVTPDSDRWRLGRYVCGRDWRSASGLETILLS